MSDLEKLEPLINTTQNIIVSLYPNVKEIGLEEIKSAVSIIKVQMNTIFPMTEEDGKTLTRELIRRYAVSTPPQTFALADRTGHEEWLEKENFPRPHWNRYRQWLLKTLPVSAVDSIDGVSEQILSLLEKPSREGCWDRRGLVVGYVQSGKTANYTALICKAADAGYRIIIVLAGLYNNLRAQTQLRIEEGFAGYTRIDEANGTFHDEKIGVGYIDGDMSLTPNAITRKEENGDASRRLLRQVLVRPEDSRPWFFVVKKNKSVLSALRNWLEKNVGSKKAVLLIDDEADHGSIDTKPQAYIEEEQDYDPEHNPSEINKQIRRILKIFDKKCYVGYTATPFANIFINHHASTEKEGEDIFPRSFILPMPCSSNYIGGAKIFGRKINIDGSERTDGMESLIRPIEDVWDGRKGWLAPSHKSTATVKGLPDSLKNAINSFVLSTAIRTVRGLGDKHTSMLVHVSRFKKIHAQVFNIISNYLDYLKYNIQKPLWVKEMRNLYETDYSLTMEGIRSCKDDYALPNRIEAWEEIENVLDRTIEEITVRELNGNANEALDYGKATRDGQTLKTILVGGEKMSRGLTFPGLTISYFLRYAKSYDSLMQMGRWFGYRDQYLDLTRLYASPEIISCYRDISDASEELMDEFKTLAIRAEEENITPEDFGLRVQSHPTMMITARNKMRNAFRCKVTYSGTVTETVSFNPQRLTRLANLNATSKFLDSLGEPSNCRRGFVSVGKNKEERMFSWKKIPAEKILTFLHDIQTPERAYRARASFLSDYIQKMLEKNELTEWSVALMSPQKKEKILYKLTEKISAFCATRQHKGNPNEMEYSIGRLLSPEIETFDMSKEAIQYALEETNKIREKEGKKKTNVPSGPWCRTVRGFGCAERGIKPEPQRGLMVIYLVAPDEGIGIEGNEPFVGFGISFPESSKSEKVDYQVNSVWQELNS